MGAKLGIYMTIDFESRSDSKCQTTSEPIRVEIVQKASSCVANIADAVGDYRMVRVAEMLRVIAKVTT